MHLVRYTCKYMVILVVKYKKMCLSDRLNANERTPSQAYWVLVTFSHRYAHDNNGLPNLPRLFLGKHIYMFYL